MATDLERLVVQLSADIRKYERSLNRARGVTDQRAKQIETRFKTMNRQIGSGAAVIARQWAAGIAAALSVRGLKQLSDAATRIDNSLKVAGLSGQELEKVYLRLRDSAVKNVAPLEALVELYSRASLSQNELGASTEDLLTFTDKVSVALRVSGKSAEEARGALLQLSQALGGGTVRAEEFNAILEGALPIAQAAAAGLKQAGGSVAKLRALVLDGQVSSEAFFRAFLAGSSILDQRVANAVVTVDQAMGNLKTALIDVAREFNNSTGASENFADGINAAAEAIVAFDVSGFIDKIAAANESLETFFDQLGNAKIFEDLNETLGLIDEKGNAINPEVAEAEQKIAGLERQVELLQERIALNTNLGFDNTEALSRLAQVQEELAAVRAAAADISAVLPGPSGVSPGSRVRGGAGPSARNRVSLDAFRRADDKSLEAFKAYLDRQRQFFETRLQQAGRTPEEIELQNRTLEVMKAAEEKGIQLSEAAAKIQAAAEILREGVAKGGAGAVGGVAGSTAAEIIKAFEGFRSTPYFDVNAYRAGYGSDTVTRLDGTVERVTKQMTVTIAEAERDLARRIAEFQAVIVGQIGAARFSEFNPQQQGALTSVAYNYGELPSSLVAAIKEGSTEGIYQAIKDLGSHNGGINRNRRNQEADIFLGGAPEGIQQSINLRQQQNQIIRETMAALQQETAAIELETQTLGASNAERERQRLIFETLNALQAQGIPITAELRAAVEAEAAARYSQVTAYDQAAVAADRLAAAQQQLDNLAGQAGQAFTGALKGLISDLARGTDATEALYNAVSRLADRLLDIALNALFQNILGGLTGGLGGGIPILGLKDGGQVRRLAGGGAVRGPGGPRDDRIPIMASNGEYMVNAASAAKHRDLLEAINADRVTKLANGGLVGSMSAPALPRFGGISSPAAPAAAQAPVVEVKNVNTFDALSFLSEALSSPGGRKVMLNLVSANPRAFRKAMEG